ncbi:DNA glycosylase [Tylopilus felleus]
MCAARRTTFTRLTRLAARKSPYHSAVTLYEARDVLKLEEAEAGPSTVKREPGDIELERDALDSDKPARTVAKRTSSRRGKSLHTDPAPAPSSPEKRKPKSKSKGAVSQRLDVPHPTPDRWAEAYAAIKEMRARIEAPVDTMGCQLAQRGESEPKNQRFATLVSLMLSSQTKDEVTDAAIAKLRAALGGAISVQALMEADDALIADCIAKVGFWRKKTQYIKQAARRLYEDFDADVPKTVEELCSLAGVGPKMAFLTLQVAWNLNVGIGVDVHVHRITNRLGWHAPPTKNPEETRVNLESWLPKVLQGEINHLLVGFGQTICLPVGPKCGECTLSAAGLCPSAQGTSAKAKTSKSAGPNPRSASSKGDDSGPKVEIEMEQQTDKEA